MCKNQPYLHIGNIYKYSYNSQYLEPIINRVGISNGIAFSKDNDIMYHSDSSINSLYANKHLVTKYDNDITPDGGTVDIYNNYYSALWGGYGIDIYTNRNKTENIQTNCKFTTSCAFGGVNMDKMLITTAYNNNLDNGKILIYDSSICGIPETPVR